MMNTLETGSQKLYQAIEGSDQLSVATRQPPRAPAADAPNSRRASPFLT
jgi:hypothetical protein